MIISWRSSWLFNKFSLSWLQKMYLNLSKLHDGPWWSMIVDDCAWKFVFQYAWSFKLSSTIMTNRTGLYIELCKILINRRFRISSRRGHSTWKNATGFSFEHQLITKRCSLEEENHPSREVRSKERFPLVSETIWTNKQPLRLIKKFSLLLLYNSYDVN